MSRAIDADALKKDLTRFYDNEVTAKQLIDEQPTIEPQRTGRWIIKPHIYNVAYCSECDFELHINDTPYCPNCGARMEGES